MSSPLWWDMDGEGRGRVVLRCCDLVQMRLVRQEGQGLVPFGSWRINGGVSGGVSVAGAERLAGGCWF